MGTTIYVFPNIDPPLLNRQTSTLIGLIARLDAESEANHHIMHQYPMLFRGLGCINESYRIQLKSDAQPSAVYAPRRIPLPMLPMLTMKLTGYSALASSSMSTSLHNGEHLLLWRPRLKVYMAVY